MPKFGVIPSDIGEGVDAIRPEFDAPTENMESLTPLLYQSGYLTIKNFDAFGEVYHLGIPNKEIRVGLFQSLLPKYLGNKGGRGGTAVAKMASLINRDDMDGALRLMKDFLSTVPYCDNTKYEGHYQQLLYIMFSLLTNYRMQVEVRTHKGRIDAVLETSNRIYVIETKLNGSAEEAMRQIEEKAYADAYKDAGKPVTKVGINFNVENEANFTEWVIIPPHSKTSLVCSAKRTSLQSKQGLFAFQTSLVFKAAKYCRFSHSIQLLPHCGIHRHAKLTAEPDRGLSRKPPSCSSFATRSSSPKADSPAP